MMKLFILLTLASVVSSDILVEVNQECPCIERQVCLVKSNYQVFSAFQESSPECPEEKVRCCSETMMLLTLLKIQRLGGLKRRTGRKLNFKFNQVDLECRIPSECTQIYGSQQFHFIHISPQKGCPEPFKIRCVVPKERHENGLQCILAPLCLEIFGTKQEHFQVHGYQTACRIGHVRCVKVKHGDSGSGVSGATTPTVTPTPDPIIQPVTPPPILDDFSTIIVTQPPEQTPRPPLDSIVITSRPPPVPVLPPVFGTEPPPDLESIVITSRPPVEGSGTIPDLESVVITSRPRLEVRPFRLEGPGGGKIIVGASDGSRVPSVQIVGPSPIFYNVPAQPQVATRDSDTDRAELEALLRLARERVRELYGG